MSSLAVPKRSYSGCLTCKRRKKKCDEQKPFCGRCLIGGFECQGYARASFVRPPAADITGRFRGEEQSGSLSLRPIQRSTNIPESLKLNAFYQESMLSLILLQYERIAKRTLFRPYARSYQDTIAIRAKSSYLSLKTMYLGARIFQTLLDANSWQSYTGWIDTFYHQVSSNYSTPGEDIANLADRLAVQVDLVIFTFMILDTSMGYMRLSNSVPCFLQLAAKLPELWTQNGAISISRALYASTHEVPRFIILDTMAALAFGSIPLLNYDTAIDKQLLEANPRSYLEVVYSCPAIVVLLLAKVNSLRISRLVNIDTIINPGTIQEIEDTIRNWHPTIAYTDEPPERVARLAVQECWRQATLIYLYMGVSGATSANKRIQSCVSQAAYLANTIEAGDALETHVFVPCLIAGAAARKENHRSILRRKVLASQNVAARLMRGADFVPSLDHLWHGVGNGGNPTTWEDYVHSRCTTMPVDI